MSIEDILKIINRQLKVPIKIDFFRAWARSGKCPFVVYAKSDGKRRGKYYFFEERFLAYLQGKDLKEAEKSGFANF